MVGPVPASGRAGVADSDPGEVGREVVASEDGRVRVLISRPDGAATLVVTDPSGETLPGPTPSGSFILEAKVPQSA